MFVVFEGDVTQVVSRSLFSRAWVSHHGYSGLLALRWVQAVSQHGTLRTRLPPNMLVVFGR